MPRVAAYTICPANAYEAIGTPGLRSPEMIPSGVPARILSEDELRCGCQRWHGPDHDSVSSRTISVIHRRRQPQSRSHEARGGWIDAMVREKSPAGGNALAIWTARVAAYPICPANACEAIATPGLRSREMIPSGVPARILSEDGLRCGCQRWHGPDHDSVSSRTLYRRPN
jgi:hypothetical protein